MGQYQIPGHSGKYSDDLQWSAACEHAHVCACFVACVCLSVTNPSALAHWMSFLPPFHFQWNRNVFVIHSGHKHNVCDICAMWGHLRKINVPWWCWGWLQNLFTALWQWRRKPDSLWRQLLLWWNGLTIKSCGSEDATLTLHTSLINVLTSEFCCCSRGLTESVFCICWNMSRGWNWGDFIGLT